LLALAKAKQVEIAHQVVAKVLSVRETERLVKFELAPPKIGKTTKTTSVDTRHLENALAEKLNTGVVLRADKKGRGTLIISFHSLEHLDGILERAGLK
jgi:ParB family chromosome partitioning protein